MKVNQWPASINTPAGIVCNPTPEQCIAAGYELAIPPTPEEIEAQKASRDAQERERLETIEALRAKYKDAVHRFCVLAGLQIVDKFEDESIIAQSIEAANSQGDFQKSLGLTQLSVAIFNSITELRRKDGDDAWERI